MSLRIRALEDFKAFYKTISSDSTAVTGIQTGVRLEGLRQTNHPSTVRRPLGHGTPVENHPTVGQAAQVHAGSTAKLDPLPIGEGLGRRLGKKVAPIGFPSSHLKATGLTMRARSYDVEFFPQLLTQCDQAATAGMGTGLQPQHALSRPHGRHQSRQIVPMQLVEHMTDDQRAAGVRPGRIGF